MEILIEYFLGFYLYALRRNNFQGMKILIVSILLRGDLGLLLEPTAVALYSTTVFPVCFPQMSLYN